MVADRPPALVTPAPFCDTSGMTTPTIPHGPLAPGTDPLADAAVAPVRSGMLVGLGTGRAAFRGVRALAGRVNAERLSLTCVSTSKATEELAVSLGLKVLDFGTVESVDFLFDGADEVDPQLRMLKGGGGAMTRERIVVAAAKQSVNILDHTKLVDRLGVKMPLPIEVVPMAVTSIRPRLAALGLSGPVRQRKDGGGTYITDNGNLIIDAALPASGPGWGDVTALGHLLDAMTGVVDHGLFIREAQTVLVEDAQGRVTRRTR